MYLNSLIQADQEVVNLYKPVLKKIIQLFHFATFLTKLRTDTLTILNAKFQRYLCDKYAFFKYKQIWYMTYK